MKVEQFSLPLSRPLSTAAGTIERREGFLVRIEIDGVVGVGESTPLPGWTESLDACEAALDAVDNPETELTNGSLDATPAARHGVSLAMLDAHSRAAGVPLYRFLGGEKRVEGVPVNATIGDGSPSETAQAVRAAVDDGYPAVKVKVGARSLSADLERLTAVRERCPSVELRCDANGAWTPAVAARAVERFVDVDVSFVEQPLPARELSEHAELRGDTVGIALDEGLVEHGIEAIIEADAADVIVCKPMALGGIDRARSVIERAREAGLDAVVTTTIDGAVARAGAVHLAASVPAVRACGVATGDRLVADLREEIAQIRDGSALVPQGKGNVPPL